jgi:hypothetical protein
MSYAKGIAVRQKKYERRDRVFVTVLMVSMSSTIVARRAEKVQSVRNWTAFAVPNGQVVYRGRYYFAWSGGHFVGAYDTLDDAMESLAFRNGTCLLRTSQKIS